MANALTNSKGIPDIFQNALQPEPYDPVGASDYSVTTLIQSPRQVQLYKRHKDKIVEDSVDLWARFRGNAIHHELEQNLTTNPRYIVERKILRFDKPEGGDESPAGEGAGGDQPRARLGRHEESCHLFGNLK